MKKIYYWAAAIVIVVVLALYGLSAARASAAELPERCSGVLISDLHPDQHDPLHYNHDCVMEPNPNYVAPIVEEQPAPPAEVQSPGPTGSATSNASPQPELSVPIPQGIPVTNTPIQATGSVPTVIIQRIYVHETQLMQSAAAPNATSTNAEIADLQARVGLLERVVDAIVDFLKSLFGFK